MTEVSGQKSEGEPKSLKGQKNIYTCAKCGQHIVTVDLDEGTTPLMIGCTGFGCDGHMKSSFYRVFDQTMRPSHEWYKPTHLELAARSQAVQQHCHNGGLLVRPIGGAEGKKSDIDTDITDVSEKLTPEHYSIEVQMPYWVGGETWECVGPNPVIFHFKGPRCHGVANTDDGAIIWSETGWDHPDLAYAALGDSY